jgi:hypothetical protein
MQLAQAVSREVRGPVGRELVEIGGDELPVTVKAVGARERSLDQLQDAIIPTTNGAPVRIADVAFVDAREALSSIRREDQQYVRLVSYDFRGPAKLARRTHTAFMQSLSAPAGYSIVDLTDGSPFERDNSEQGLWLVFAVGILLVVLTVALVFDSVWGTGLSCRWPCWVSAAFWASRWPSPVKRPWGTRGGAGGDQSILKLIDAAWCVDAQKRDAGEDAHSDAGMVPAPPLTAAA